MSDMLIGTTAYDTADTELLKSAGIRWMRVGFAFPFVDRIGGELTDSYKKSRSNAEKWSKKGFKLIATTPGLGIGTYKPDSTGKMQMNWKSHLPEWMGEPGSDKFYDNYAAICRFLAEDVGRIVPIWQICNEIDWPQFAGSLNLLQACELVLRCVMAIKKVDSSLQAGTNCAGNHSSYFFFGRLFCDSRVRPDYCGIDQYYGTWQPGGPEDWATRISEIHALTGGAKVLVNEWGYASAGKLMTPQEKSLGQPNCQLKKWQFAWGGGHDPNTQAEFVKRAFDNFIAHADKLAGICFYRWEDQEKCWQCGQPDCPVETAWGLVDRQSRPKPAYTAFCDGAARLLNR